MRPELAPAGGSDSSPTLLGKARGAGHRATATHQSRPPGSSSRADTVCHPELNNHTFLVPSVRSLPPRGAPIPPPYPANSHLAFQAWGASPQPVVSPAPSEQVFTTPSAHHRDSTQTSERLRHPRSFSASPVSLVLSQWSGQPRSSVAWTGNHGLSSFPVGIALGALSPASSTSPDAPLVSHLLNLEVTVPSADLN